MRVVTGGSGGARCDSLADLRYEVPCSTADFDETGAALVK